jgi:sulfur relay protein TusB/DsrH
MEPASIKLASEHKDDEVGICLLQDAVYLGCQGKTETLSKAIRDGVKTFAAKKDVELRGIVKLIHPEIKAVDYHEIIDLVLNYEHIINI